MAGLIRAALAASKGVRFDDKAAQHDLPGAVRSFFKASPVNRRTAAALRRRLAIASSRRPVVFCRPC
jgi:hypothetical protein